PDSARQLTPCPTPDYTRQSAGKTYSLVSLPQPGCPWGWPGPGVGPATGVVERRAAGAERALRAAVTREELSGPTAGAGRIHHPPPRTPHPPLDPKCPPPSPQRSPPRALLHPPPVTRSSRTSGRYRLRLRNRPRSAARQPNDVQRVHPLHRIARVEHRNGQVDQLLVADVGVVGGDHDAVRAGEGLGRERDRRPGVAVLADLGHVRVVVEYGRALFLEQLDDVEC